MKTTKKSVFICVENLRSSVGKITLLFSLILLLFSCIKLEENDKKYTKRKLKKMILGTWRIEDYVINGSSYLDSFFLVNKDWNCTTYVFKEWENKEMVEKYQLYETGSFTGDCQTQTNNKGYTLNLVDKKINIEGKFFVDSICFFDINPRFKLIKLENQQMIWEDENEQFVRTVYFKKQ
jgi:hypothetical protein